MKNNKKLIILILAFVVVLGGASFLYSRLSDSIENNNLSTLTDSDKEETHNSDNAVSNEADTSNSDAENSDNGDDTSNGKAENSDNEDNNVVAAPDFTVTDASGNSVNLSDFLGTPVVVNFWASWCGPCKSEMPDFETAYTEYDSEIQFMMVNLTDGYDETVEVAQNYVNDKGFTFPVYFDTIDSNAALTYGVFSIPSTFFIDAEGNIVAHATGALDLETLEKGISMIH